jgi:magnesium transporter
VITLRWVEGEVTNRADDSSRLAELIKRPGAFVWMDVSDLDEPALHSLLEPLGFHPLAIEDASRPHQRPKIDEFDDYFFLVTHEVGYDPDEKDDQRVQDHQIGVFIRSNLVVTVHSNSSHGLDALRGRCDSRNKVLHNGADFFLYNLLDVLVDGYFPILESLDDQIDDLEDRIVKAPRQDLLDEIFILKRSLIHLRKLAGPTREVLTMLTTRDFPAIRSEMMPYFRDVSDHLIRIYEILDSYRDLMSGALDAYLSNISNQLNLVMQRLTIVTVIFLPLTFVTGVFGMNFTVQPWEGKWDHGQVFWTVMVGMTLLGSALAYWFHRKRLI